MAAPSVEFNLRGWNRVRNQLRATASFHPEYTDPIIGKHAKEDSAFLRQKPYPSYLPHFTHTRKYHRGLQGRYRARRVKRGQWRVVNRTPYAAWVIRKASQRRHPSFARWWTIEDTLQARAPKLTKALSVGLVKLWERQRD